MIEGLRVLPGLEETRAKPGQSDCLNCDVCMKSNDYEVRRVMRCGFIPESERLDGMRFIPDNLDRDKVTICPGYTTTLPEVFDASINYDHYDTGQLTAACNGRVPIALWNAVSLLRNSVRALDAYRSREKADAMKNGGGHGHR